MNFQFLFNYIKTMKCYFYFLVFQLIMIISLIGYIFVDYKNRKHTQTIVFIIECFLMTLVIMEIVLRFLMNRKNYFKSIWNIVDVVGTSLILALFFVLIHFEAGATSEHEEDDIIPAALLASRYLTQIVRIILNLKQNQEIREIPDIEFENVKQIEEGTDHHDEESNAHELSF